MAILSGLSSCSIPFLRTSKAGSWRHCSSNSIRSMSMLTKARSIPSLTASACAFFLPNPPGRAAHCTGTVELLQYAVWLGVDLGDALQCVVSNQAHESPWNAVARAIDGGKHAHTAHRMEPIKIPGHPVTGLVKDRGRIKTFARSFSEGQKWLAGCVWRNRCCPVSPHRVIRPQPSALSLQPYVGRLSPPSPVRCWRGHRAS